MPTPTHHNPLHFPPVEHALSEPNGLLAVGGDLSSERLINAYKNGIFPWFNPGEPALWWSPDPRAVLIPEDMHISRSMHKFLRRSTWRVTINHAFEQVIAGCASERNEGTWIVDDIQKAYITLNQLGIAHSVEVWQDSELVGGLYGVGMGQLFCGESMFSRLPNASKSALYHLCRHFVQHGGRLIDCQIINDHTASLGAIEIARTDYLRCLLSLQNATIDNICWQKQQLT